MIGSMMNMPMSREPLGNRNPSGRRGGFWARLRAEYAAVERDIQEEFPEWPEIKRRLRRTTAIVLTLGLAVAGLVFLHTWWEGREQARRRMERARTIQLISPTEEVREETIEFVWRPSPIATSYVVELSDSEYRLLWQSDPVKLVELTLPDAVRRRLERGRVYIWQVRGFDDKGNEVARSPFDHITLIR